MIANARRYSHQKRAQERRSLDPNVFLGCAKPSWDTSWRVASFLSMLRDFELCNNVRWLGKGTPAKPDFSIDQAGLTSTICRSGLCSLRHNRSNGSRDPIPATDAATPQWNLDRTWLWLSLGWLGHLSHPQFDRLGVLPLASGM